MATKLSSGDKISDTACATEPGHVAWKRAKIERGLSQSADRASMISADEAWRKLGLER